MVRGRGRKPSRGQVIMQMRDQGWSYDFIARDLGLKPRSVQRALQREREEAMSQLTDQIAEEWEATEPACPYRKPFPEQPGCGHIACEFAYDLRAKAARIEGET